MMKRAMCIGLLMMVATMAMAEWFAYEDEDMLTGKTVTSAANVATASENTLGPPGMAIRSGDVVFIHWGGYHLSTETRAIYMRFGDGEVGTVSVTLSTTNDATFLDSSVIDQMLEVNQVVASVFDVRGNRMTAVWDMAGLREALAAVR